MGSCSAAVLFLEHQYCWTWAQILAKIKLQYQNIGQITIRLDMFRPSAPTGTFTCKSTLSLVTLLLKVAQDDIECQTWLCKRAWNDSSNFVNEILCFWLRSYYFRQTFHSSYLRNIMRQENIEICMRIINSALFKMQKKKKMKLKGQYKGMVSYIVYGYMMDSSSTIKNYVLWSLNNIRKDSW